MKLKHLIQAYNFNLIPAIIENEIDKTSGTIKFYDGIHGAYLLDEEDIPIQLRIICAQVARGKKLIEYTEEVIKVLQKSIELIANVPQKEANMILRKLGLFDKDIKNIQRSGKKIKHLDHNFKLQMQAKFLMLDINEEPKGLYKK